MSLHFITGFVDSDDHRREPPRKDEVPPFVMKPVERRDNPPPARVTEDESSRSARHACKPKAKPKSGEKDRPHTKKSVGAAKQPVRHPVCGDRASAAADRSKSGSLAQAGSSADGSAPSDFDMDQSVYAFPFFARDNASELASPANRNDDFRNADSSDDVFGRREKEPFADSLNQATFSSASDGKMDFEPLMDKLMPMTSDDGIFEITLPSGETMGVVVNSQPTQISFFLSPSTAKMSDLLRPQQMELEGHLERRIRRNVKITVL